MGKQITIEEVQKVAKLARLGLTEAETQEFAKQLGDILVYVDKLRGWETQDVEPTATVLGQTNVFREDTLRSCLSVDEALANAPDAEGGTFRVPKII